MGMTTIEWTQNPDGSAGRTWNPTTGCDRVSPGCDNCYALTMARRLKAMGSEKYQRDGDPRTSGPGFGLSTHQDVLTEPLRWRKPRKVFVNSMSDLFHDAVPDEFLARVFAVMAATPQHTYQILTKRHGRMKSLIGRPDFLAMVCDRWLDYARPGSDFTWPIPNAWLGVSVEDQKRAELRISALLDTPAAVRFLSCEPLIGPLELRYWLGGHWACPDCGFEQGAHMGNVNCWKCGVRHYPPPYRSVSWVICGGESGCGARPMELAWAQQIVNDCKAADVPVFVKQLGAQWEAAQGRRGKGGDISQWPTDLQVREWPHVAVDPAR